MSTAGKPSHGARRNNTACGMARGGRGPSKGIGAGLQQRDEGGDDGGLRQRKAGNPFQDVGLRFAKLCLRAQFRFADLGPLLWDRTECNFIRPARFFPPCYGYFSGQGGLSAAGVRRPCPRQWPATEIETPKSTAEPPACVDRLKPLPAPEYKPEQRKRQAYADIDRSHIEVVDEIFQKYPP
ncbi:MAG: hypothetical protein FD149_1734 [Rhodospirillaceae bacterium]|nr:MAG: hypothetical protein FD149_1734 [Rhodospirillaceae bacterium]